MLNPCIGIIGGVGPYAGLDFMRNIFANTRAVKDQDHLNCMLISCPSIIPDRTDFLLENREKENPAFGMFECARRLYAAGVRYTAVACNTAHADKIFTPFREMAQKHLPEMNLVNMLKTCADYANKSLNVARLGLIATKGTHQSRVYREYFSDTITLIEPEPADQEQVHQAIYSKDFGIKAYSQPVAFQAKDTISTAIRRLIDRGAEAVILGCTELPLAVYAQDFPVPILDPALLTARRLIALIAPEKLA
jgi:aspartate racemase